MALRHVQTKPQSRFVVVDDLINTWAVLDKLTGEKVKENIRDPLLARQLAEQYSLDEANDKGSSGG